MARRARVSSEASRFAGGISTVLYRYYDKVGKYGLFGKEHLVLAFGKLAFLSINGTGTQTGITTRGAYCANLVIELKGSLELSYEAAITI
jgi:hypothetical protein